MDDRHAYLLHGLVREYVRTARPVGSVALSHVLELTASPATVRALLHDLEVDGYLEQPHTSAGRIPTDKGYRHYVDHVQTRIFNEAQQRQIERDFTEALVAYQQLTRATSKLLAHLSHAVAVSGSSKEGDVHETGWHEIFEQPEGREMHVAREISTVLNSVDEYLEELPQPGHVAVYIGRENPFFPAQHITVMIKSVALPGNHVVLGLVGPKRMSYERNIMLLEALAQAISNKRL
ncbi:MAG: hypothetical protein WD972_01250 [Candidatus Andersenbacteria bacterium]